MTSSVIADKGVSRLTLRDVADQLGFNHQALYYYVRSKDELVHAVLRDAMQRAIEELRNSAEISEPGPRLTALIRRHVQLTVREQYLFRIYERIDSLPQNLRAELEALEREYVHVFRDCVESAIDAGVIARGDPFILSRALLGMATWAYRWAQEFGPGEVESAIQDMLRLVSLADTGGQQHGG